MDQSFQDNPAKPDKHKEDELALYDELTGIYNRRGFNKYLTALTQEANQKNENLLLMVMDIDHFKYANDKYGHLCGDEIIKTSAKLLRKSVRDVDIVCRYGGDEFVILFPRANKDIVHQIAERIRKSIYDHKFNFADVKEEIRVSVSIGYASFPNEAPTAKELFMQADKALYASKDLGRNRVSGITEVTLKIEKMNTLKQNIYLPPFCVNKDVLDKVKSALFAEAKKRRVILVKGHRGVGKTRFVEEIKDYAQSNYDKIIVTLSPNTIEKNQPYKFLTQALIEFSKNNEKLYKSVLERISSSSREKLASFMPELLMVYDKQVGEYKEINKADIFFSLCELMRVISLSKDMLICVDNIHWVDEATLDVLKYLIVSDESQNIIVFGSSCIDDILDKESSYPMLKWISDVAEVEIVFEVELNPLTKEQTDVFLESVFAQTDIDQKFCDVMYKVTSGNILFMVEVLNYLFDKEKIHIENDNWNFDRVKIGEMPASFKELIHQRYEELSPEVKDILTVAASIGQDFNFNILSKLKNKNEGYLFDIIDKAKDAHIMQTVMEVAGEKVKFLSDGLREAIYGGLDTKIKKNAHTQIGEFVEQQHKGNEANVSATLAYHFDKADAKQKAIEYADMVAKSSDAIFSDKEAMGLFEQALKQREMREKMEPIAEELLAVVYALIKNIVVSVWNIRIYPPENKIVKNSKFEIFKNLEKVLKSSNDLTLSVPESMKADAILVNAQPLKISDCEKLFCSTFITMVKNSNLHSISFKKGLSFKEVVSFLEIFSDPDIYLKKSEDWKFILREYKISNISVDEVIYRKVYSEDEKKLHKKEFLETIAMSRSILDNTFQTVPNNNKANTKRTLSKADIEDINLLIERVMTKNYPEDMALLKVKLADFLSIVENVDTLSENNLASKNKFIKTVSSEETDIFSEAISYMPDEMAVNTIVDLYKKARGSVDGIKIFIDKLFSNGDRRRRLMDTLYKRLKSSGMSHECLIWLVDPVPWFSIPLSKRTQLLLDADNKTIVEIGVKNNVEPTLLELFNSKDYDVLTAIIEKIFKGLYDNNSDSRSDLVGMVLSVIKLLSNDMVTVTIFTPLVESVLNLLDRQTDEFLYSEIVDCLVTLVHGYIRLGKYKLANSIVSKLRAHSDNIDINKNLRVKARIALESVVNDDVENRIISVLDDVDSKSHDEVLQLMFNVGKSSISTLVDFLVNNESESIPFNVWVIHKKVMDTLKKIGDEYVFNLNSKFFDQRWYVVKNAVVIAGTLGLDGCVGSLSKLVDNQDDRIRRAVVIALRNIATVSAIDTLADFLMDANTELKELALDGLCTIATEELVPKLEEIKKNKKFRKDVDRIIQSISERSQGNVQ